MSEMTLPTTPYKGLMPYSEEDAPFFFGREPETEIITANLMASRLTLLYGASGVGKTSVLRAGVAYHLRQLARQNLAEHGTPEFAIVVFASWRDDPIVGLTDRVRDSVAQVLETRFLGENGFLSTPSRSLAQTLQAWAERMGGDLLIILDQFEEYFLYHPQEDGEGTFAVEFPRAVNRPDLRASFLISIREDSLAKLDHFKGRIPNLFDNYLRVEHLDREEARAAIEKPIEQYNRLHAAEGQQVSIEPALVEAVLEQVKTGQVVLGEAGRGVIGGMAGKRVETPYLQLVMTRLWDEEMRTGSRVLQLETLGRLGGAERIVRTHLDAAMSGLPSKEQNVAAHAFHYLVTPSGSKIAHTVPDLAQYAGLPEAQLAPVLDKLSGADVRILRPVAPPPDQRAAPRYQIFHDVLAPAILDWRTRYLRRVRARRWRVAGIVLGVVILFIIAGLILNAQNTRVQLELKAQEVTKAKQELATTEAQLAQVREQVNGAQEQLVAANEGLKQAQQEMAAREEEAEGYRQEVANLKKRVDELNKEVAAREEEAKRYRQEVADLQKRVDELNKEAATRKAEAEHYRQEVADLQKRMDELTKEVAARKAEAERYRQEAVDLETRTDELKKTLEGLTQVQKHAFPGDVELSIKYLASLYPRESEPLIDILNMQYAGVGWKLGGLSPEEGFDSPSFAAYVLEKHGLLPVPASSSRYRLREVLPARDQPRVGDVVFYELGYTLFYFVDEQQRPFVVGMTPLGILALEPDFARILGYGEVKYR